MTETVVRPVVTAFAGHQHVWHHIVGHGWRCWLCPIYRTKTPEPQVYVDPYERVEAGREAKLDHILAHAPVGGGRVKAGAR